MSEKPDLVGAGCEAIAFVRDYVEIHFDRGVLRALSNPHGLADDRPWRFPDAGSADALCEYIGMDVFAFDVEAEVHITVGFEDGFWLVVPLAQEHRSGPEAANFIGADGAWWVW